MIFLELEQMTLSTNRPLYEEEWFHGVLPREEVVRLLKSEGDFLVRETIRNDESQIVLSVCWNGHKHFIVQTTIDGHYRFEGPAFPSIQELIRHQHLSELPVTGRSGAVLKRPVTRELWELSNDDVILHDKIGRVRDFLASIDDIEYIGSMQYKHKYLLFPPILIPNRAISGTSTKHG